MQDFQCKESDSFVPSDVRKMHYVSKKPKCSVMPASSVENAIFFPFCSFVVFAAFSKSSVLDM